jgi:hypothetical protein
MVFCKLAHEFTRKAVAIVRGRRATATALRSGFSLDPNTTNKGFSCFRPGAYFKTISHPLVLAKPNRGRITRFCDLPMHETFRPASSLPEHHP